MADYKALREVIYEKGIDSKDKKGGWTIILTAERNGFALWSNYEFIKWFDGWDDSKTEAIEYIVDLTKRMEQGEVPDSIKETLELFSEVEG